MKKWQAFFCLIALALLAGVAHAQLTAGTIVVPHEGTIVTTGPVSDGLNEVWTSTYKDRSGVVDKTITYKKDPSGKWTFSSRTVKPSGTLKETMDGTISTEGGTFLISSYKLEVFNKDGELAIEHYTAETVDGKLHVTKRAGGETKEYDETDRRIDDMNRMFLWPFHHSSETRTSQVPKNTCQTNFNVSLGPSYLSRDFGDEKKSAWGVQLVANYNFNKHIAAGVDLSTYSTKIGDEKLTTSFYLLDGVYTFGKGSQECPPHVSVFGRILIGMMHEKFAGGSGSGPAYGAGVGSDYRFSNNFSIGVGFDYLRGKFDNESVSNVRGSVLVTFRFSHVAPV